MELLIIQWGDAGGSDGFDREKNALVTGSSRGLGKQYALDLARAGASVIIHDVNEEAAVQFNEAASGSDVAKEIAGLGVKAEFIAGDLSDPDHVKALIEQSIQRWVRSIF